MGNEVAVLREGRLVQSAGPTALYRQPIDPEVARFVGEAVVLPGEASFGRVACALGELEIRNPAIDGRVEVMIRPEQILARRADAGEGSGGEGVPARVVDHTYYGPDTVIRLALESDPDTIVKTKTFADDVPKAGERVELTVHGAVVTYPLEKQTRAPVLVNDGATAKPAEDPTGRNK